MKEKFQYGGQSKVPLWFRIAAAPIVFMVAIYCYWTKVRTKNIRLVKKHEKEIR